MGSLMYILLLCSSLPHLYSTQTPSHRHNSRLDTNPDELSPVRPQRRTTTQKSFTVRDQFLLPEPPYGPLPTLSNHDLGYDDDYFVDDDFVDEMPFHHSADHHRKHTAGSGAIHDYDYNSHGPDDISTTTESQDEDIDWYYGDESGSAGHKNHLRNTSTAIACAWQAILMSLLLTRMVALIQK